MRLPFTGKNKSGTVHAASAIHPSLLLYIAMKNLMAKRLRSSLTIIGIIIGAGTIIFLVSLAQGLHETVNSYVIGSKSVKAIDITSPNPETVPLSLDKVNKMRDLAHVSQVEPAYVVPGKIAANGSLTDAVLYGATDNYIDLSALKLVAGKNTVSEDNGIVVSSSLLDLIGQSDANKALNNQIEIETILTLADSTTKEFKSKFTIVGIADIGSGVAVYLNGKTFTSAGMHSFGQVKVVADDQSYVSTIREQVSGLGLTTSSPLDTLAEINTIFSIFTAIVIGFGGIGMVIAILGMFNTLTISLLERTSEIGLLITMGARKADVRRLLIIEALLLSFVGGIGGIIVAWILGLIINTGLTYFANSRGIEGVINAFTMTPLHIGGTLLFALIIGLIVAFYPSRRAAKINPITALRHE